MLHAKAFTKDGTPVVAVRNIGDNRLSDDDIPRVDQETALRLERCRFRAGDIVFREKGAVNRRALVKPEYEGWLQGSDCIRLRLNQSSSHPRFISFVLGSPSHRAWFVQQAYGATMPSLNQEILSRLPLPIPTSEEQEVVAGILGGLDDKIDLNRKLNEILGRRLRRRGLQCCAREACICSVNCDDCSVGSEQQITGLWVTNHIRISFNGFVETVYYGQFSTPVSVASAFADLFSRDYLPAGLRANARSWS